MQNNVKKKKNIPQSLFIQHCTNTDTDSIKHYRVYIHNSTLETEIYFMCLFYIYCYFKCTFLSLEPMCQRKIVIFMLCILMNNFYLI